MLQTIWHKLSGSFKNRNTGTLLMKALSGFNTLTLTAQTSYMASSVGLCGRNREQGRLCITFGVRHFENKTKLGDY